MNARIWLIIFAAIMMLLMPLVPRMLRFRIWLLRKLRWNWFAEFHERHFAGLVAAIRIAMLMGVILLIIIAFGYVRT